MRKHKKLIAALSAVILALAAVMPAAALAADTPRAAETRNYEPLYMTGGGWVELNSDGTIPEEGINKNTAVWYQGSAAVLQAHPGAKDEVYQSRIVWTKWDGNAWQEVTSGWLDADHYALGVTVPGDQVTYRCTAIWDDAAHAGEEWVMDYVVTGTPTTLVMDGPYDAAAGQKLAGAEVSVHWEPGAPVDRNGQPIPITWASSEGSVQGISLGYTGAQAATSVYQIQSGVMPLEGFKIYCDVRTGDSEILSSNAVYIESVFMAKDPDNDGGGFMTPGGVPGPMTAKWSLSPGGQPNAVSGKYTYSWSVASPNGKVPDALEKECQTCTGLTFASKTPINEPGTYVFTCTPVCNGAAIPTSAAVFSLLVGNAAEHAQYDISFSRNPENINALPDSIVAGSPYTLYAHAEPGAPWPDDAKISWTVTDASGRKVVPSTVVEQGSPAEINLDENAVKATAPTHYTFTAAVTSGGATLVEQQIEIPVLPFYEPTLEPLTGPAYVRTSVTISISGTSGAQGANVQWLNDGVVIENSGTFSISPDTRSLTITPQNAYAKYVITAKWVVGTQAASRESVPVAFVSQLFPEPLVIGDNSTCLPGETVTVVAKPWYEDQKWPDGAKINWACSDGKQYPASTVSGNKATLQYTGQNTDTTMFQAVLVDSEGNQMSYTGMGTLIPALLDAPTLTITPEDGLIPSTVAGGDVAKVAAKQPPAGMTLAWTIDGQAMDPSSLPTGVTYDGSTRTVSVTGRSAVIGAAFMSGSQQVSQTATAIVQYTGPDPVGVTVGLITGESDPGTTAADTTVVVGSKPQILAKIARADSTAPTGTFTWTIVHEGKSTTITAPDVNDKKQDGYIVGDVTATSTEATLTIDMALPGLYAISAAFRDEQGNATSSVGVWGFYVAPLMLYAKPDPLVISLGDSAQLGSWLYGEFTDISQLMQAGAKFYWTGSGAPQSSSENITVVPQAAGLQTYSVQCRLNDIPLANTANAIVRVEQPSVTLQGPDTLRMGARAGYLATTPSMETALPGDGIYTWSATGGTIEEDNDIGWYTPSASGTQTISVRVTDHSGKLLGTASKTVEVIGEDEPDIPDMEVALKASPSDTVESGTEVTVTGTVSNVPEGAELEYLWTVPTELGGKTDSAQWTFEAPKVDTETQYTAALAVTAGTAAAQASISITVKPGAAASVPPSHEPGPEESVLPSAPQGPGVQPSVNPSYNPGGSSGQIPGQTPGGVSSQTPGASSGSESSQLPAQVIPTVRPQQSSPVSFPDARPSRPAGTTGSSAPAASASSQPEASASAGGAASDVLPPAPDAPLDYELDRNPTGGGFILVGIPISTPSDINTVMDLLLSISAPSGSRVEILDANDEPASLGGAVATGMVVRVTGPDGTVISEVPIVVAGDVMGTGQMDLTQLVWMAQCVLGERPITGLFLLAGDFTGTGSINLTDLVRESWLLRAANQR